jgi:prepilin-type processing-associated H-X9-DG protein
MASTATDSFGRRWRGAVFWDEERARLAARSTLLYMTVERCFVSAAEGERLWSNEDRANWLLCDGHVPHYIHRSSRSSLRDPRFDGGERDSEVAPPPMCRALTSRPNLALAGGGLYVRSRGDSGIFDLSPNPSWDAWEPASSEVQALLLRGCEAVRLSATRPEIGALLSNSVAVEVYWIGDVTPIEEGSEVKEDRETRRGVASQLYVVDASGLERLRLWRGAWSQQAAESWERSAGGGAGSFQRREPLTSS